VVANVIEQVRQGDRRQYKASGYERLSNSGPRHVGLEPKKLVPSSPETIRGYVADLLTQRRRRGLVSDDDTSEARERVGG
jgi:hypothetical protein